ncbi:calcineurin-like phosphoesterase family protein [Actinomycetospora succinea]|uniref:Calcineurin-like phosphoesterase family protein n=1 Tax=Actinomycetospora succinea TaxID=663603 RepID=A0A4R6VRA4_9PSEU|nr:metallophosphoesterase [Actinomycetospora succinea]TDQ65097.1 calcineurin-like phosphoesterase family protein [Actinomycetospora succinea]
MASTDEAPRKLPAVRWLSPTELIRTGVTVLLGSTVAAYADKRDVMAGTTFAQHLAVYDVGDGEDFWFDFLCDTGDGFRAMATVATLLGAPEVAVDGEVLPRGRVLLMGGDEVYPVAGTLAYELRLESPLQEQFVDDPDGETPTVYAIPGNHDWYDGLTAFLRVFCQGRHFAGWNTDQRRSYFALALPRGWWVLAIDIQLDTYVDATQLEWFRDVVARIPDGDRLVLLTATPAWYGAQDGDDRSMDRLAFFLREVLGGRDLPIRLVLTGDTHHYAVYELDHPDHEQVLVTAGLGGAYTSPTHFLAPTLDVTTDLVDPGPQRATGTHRYVRGPHTFPTVRRSRAEAFKVLWRLPLRNGLLLPLLVLLPALVIVPWVLGVPAVSVIAGVAVAGGSYAFVVPQRAGRLRRLGLGLALTVPELAVAIGATVVATRLDDPLATVLVVLAAGLLSSLVLSTFLLLAARGANRNELFAAQSIEDHKGFLRLRVADDGTLTVYALGVEKVPRRWRWAPGATPRWRPHTPVDVRLVDEPIVLRP